MKRARSNIQEPEQRESLLLKGLYRWFQKNQRKLPFRNTRDVYAVWVSEIMLQQTRMAVVLPCYQKFMKRFPSLQALADAPEEKLLESWKGLGYYRRAKNLQAGVRTVITKHQGRFPEILQEAKQIEGIGPYTAAAILSISYGVNVAVLDGNVKRILMRLYCLPSTTTVKELERKAQELLEQKGRTHAGLHNQALMELGALICTSGIPRCLSCALQSRCLAFQKGGAQFAKGIPATSQTNKIELELKVWLLFDSLQHRSVLMLKEQNSRFLRDLWFFPYSYGNKAPFANQSAPCFPRFLHARQKKFSFFQSPEKIHSYFHHFITNHKIRVSLEYVYLKEEMALVCQYLEKHSLPKQTQWDWKHVSTIEKFLVSSLSRKIFHSFQEIKLRSKCTESE